MIKNYRITLIDVSGKVWASDSNTGDTSERLFADNKVKHFTNYETIQIRRNGTLWNFNTANVIAATYTEWSDPA